MNHTHATKLPSGKPGRYQRGLSLVEMMVGLTIGMIVVAGASLMMVNQIGNHRRLVLETQVQQDLRAAADLLLRDIRRSGYRRRAEESVWASGAPAPVANVYAKAGVNADGEVRYSYTRETGPAAQEDDALTADENFGYRMQHEELQFFLGGRWQPLTDARVVRITAFNARIDTQTIALDEFCPKPCAAGTQCPPTQQVRNLVLSLSGEANHDRRIIRTVTVSARLRNDAITGGC